MTPLSIDYGPGTIAHKRGQIQLAQERLDARRTATTRTVQIILFWFVVVALVVLQVFPILEHPLEHATHSIFEDSEQWSN